MRIINTAIAAVAMLAALASCSKDVCTAQDVDMEDTCVKGDVTLTASFADTKMSYSRKSNGFYPEWEKGDIVVGRSATDANATFTLTVTSVNNGTAILAGKGVPTSGNVYLIYKQGATSWSDGLSISYAGQTGDKTMPAVVFSEGTITSGTGHFEFRNAGAILGIENAKGLDAGASISSVVVSGSNLSGATVSISSNTLVLSATSTSDDKITITGLSGITVGSDNDRTLSTPVTIALPAGAGTTITEVKVISSAGKYICAQTSAKTVAVNNYININANNTFDKEIYYFTVDAQGTKVVFAQGNLYCTRTGTGKAPDYYKFAFAFESNQWACRSMAGVTSGEYTRTVNDGSYTTSTPYHDSDWYTSGLFQWHAGDTNPTAANNGGYGALTKDGSYDKEAAELNWGNALISGHVLDDKLLNQGWRSLTSAELEYLVTVRKVKGESGKGKTYIWTDGIKTTASSFVPGIILFPDNWEGDISAGNQIPEGCVFLPAAGWRVPWVDGTKTKSKGEYGGSIGYYWSSTPNGNTQAKCLYFTSDDDASVASASRADGMSVRLVREL